MIKITAKAFKNGVGLKIEVEGNAENVINEAMAIVNELPKSLKKANPDAYHEFLKRQLSRSLDHIFDEVLGSDPDEDEEDEDDDESDEI